MTIGFRKWSVLFWLTICIATTNCLDGSHKALLRLQYSGEDLSLKYSSGSRKTVVSWNQHASPQEWLELERRTSGCIKLRGGNDWIGGIVGSLSGQKEGKVEVLQSVSQLIKRWDKFKAPRRNNEDDVREKVQEVLPGMIRMFSGCRDDQTSADVCDTSVFGLEPAHKEKKGWLSFLKGPDAGGACTSAMMLALTRKKTPTWIELLDDMRSILAEKSFSQVPQLSSSRQIQLNDEFHLKQSGKRTKALLIGINYVGHEVGELKGCHNDVKMMQEFVGKHGYDKSQMMVLMDDGKHVMPTFENILEAFKWLVDGAQAGDSLFLHYSGHGGQIADDNGDEKDGLDETLLPVDYQTAGMIRDDAVYEMLCAPLPQGCMLTVVMDCCHSGSALDLPYMFTCSAEGSEHVHNGDFSSLPLNLDFSWDMAVEILKKMLRTLQENSEKARQAVGVGVQKLQEKGHSDIKEFVAKMAELQENHDVKALILAMKEMSEKAESEEVKAALDSAVTAIRSKGEKDIKVVMEGMKRAWEERGREDVEKFVAGMQELGQKAEEIKGKMTEMGAGIQGFLSNLNPKP